MAEVLVVLSAAALLGLFSWTVYHAAIFLVGWPHSRRYLRRPFRAEDLRNPVDLPSFSIIVAARDEENVIEPMLENLVALQYPKHLLQVIVAEDGSTDRTRELCEASVRDHPQILSLHEDLSSGKAGALNRAMKHANGEFLLFLDADTRFERDILLKAAKFFHDNPDSPVAQAIIDTYPSHPNLVAKLDKYETLLWYRGVLAGRDRLGTFVALCGTGMFIKRSILRQAGEWDEQSLAEDLDMAIRPAAMGQGVRVLPVRVWRQPPYSLRDFVDQRKRWWGGAIQAFPTGLRLLGDSTMPLKRRVDMLVQLASPFVFVLGTLYLLAATLLNSLQVSQPAIIYAALTGIATSQIVLLGLILGYSVASRSARDLDLIPGVYLYWALQLYAVLAVTIQLLLRKPPEWKVTKKRRVPRINYGVLDFETASEDISLGADVFNLRQEQPLDERRGSDFDSPHVPSDSTASWFAQKAERTESLEKQRRDQEP